MGIHIENYLRIDSSEASGEVALSGARIGGVLDCSGAKLRNADGEALSANVAEIHSALVLNGVSVAGEVMLLGAKIGGNFECSGAKFSKADRMMAVRRGSTPVLTTVATALAASWNPLM